MTVEVSTAQRIAWDFLDDNDFYGGNTLRNWATGVVEAVEEQVEWGRKEDCLSDVENRLYEISDNAVPVYTGQKVALVADSTTLSSTEPEIEPERKTPEGMCDAVLNDLARNLTYAAFAALTKGDD
jgi:hypothetical protein